MKTIQGGKYFELTITQLNPMNGREVNPLGDEPVRRVPFKHAGYYTGRDEDAINKYNADKRAWQQAESSLKTFTFVNEEEEVEIKESFDEFKNNRAMSAGITEELHAEYSGWIKGWKARAQKYKLPEIDWDKVSDSFQNYFGTDVPMVYFNWFKSKLNPATPTYAIGDKVQCEIISEQDKTVRLIRNDNSNRF